MTVNNRFFKPNCIVTLSAEAFADGDSLFIGFSIDGGSCQEQVGPRFFITDEPELEANTAVTIIELGKGTHTIQPCFLSDEGGIVGISSRCLVVECKTH